MFNIQNIFQLFAMLNLLKICLMVACLSYMEFPVNGNSGMDLTLSAAAKGEDVVEACIGKLEGTNLFQNDYGFTKRIALVESDFGENSAVINANPEGGIWQINSTIFQTVQPSNISKDLSQNAEAYLGQESTNLLDNVFSVPMRSAFIARVFIDVVRGDNSIPTTVNDQAEWWSTNYHPGGSKDNFIRLVESYENTTNSGCISERLDLWFLLDGSGSIAAVDFNTSLNFVIRMTEFLPISGDNVRTGLMIYSTNTDVISYFNEHTSRDEFIQAVSNVTQPRGGTNTGLAIEEVRTSGFNTTNGARPRSEGAPRVLMVLTDGLSHDDVGPPSAEIKDDGVTVIAVGVGPNVNDDEIKEISSEEAFNYHVNSFDELVETLSGFLRSCEFPVIVQDNATTDMTIAAGATQYVNSQLPINGFVTLTFALNKNSTNGTVYISTFVSKPSAAIYDIFVILNQTVTTIIIYDDGNDDLSISFSIAYGTRRLRKRNVGSARESTTRALYIAIKAPQESPLSLELTSIPSDDRQVATIDYSGDGRTLRFSFGVFVMEFWMLLVTALALA